MSLTRRHVAFALLTWLPAAAVPVPAAALPQEAKPGDAPVVEAEHDPELEAQVRELASRLRCPTCRALSVQDSPSGMAQEMKDLIREQLKAGKTPEEITAYFVDRYGEWILLKPTAQGFNWTVWLLPVLLLAGGLFFVLMTARRWVEEGRARATALTEDGDEGGV
ncbi:MAG: cytochrome c-type biogenesis protein CcmH [Gemmatimonadetes bacterium]|uniref:Cytochrome c-type biogenesis protein n=1 Tax=Candidatus Kutchimonas denitrificans TaxID=3056748 RepID=A0AAE5C857_9BACT|nr:cytochrome c-type biogenesis protein CcmH [Gemmatimonadota bacterium]NIR74191.1 cytochrome c-type biogenesis protein CcmH [Candidatus Kutchimonas denitrificans]NIR99813.1 cytochrome c-type biogenesis protein CcmH [Gemmatimonadota bacterium]NIT65402.1 cytochrome c-type biogenesis protein CcmH [Gemmatimonadota bacterium]NIU51768.1 cytochrome c-type biogenesis protein CcmH [Gemmatimonadota bacterium]